MALLVFRIFLRDAIAMKLHYQEKVDFLSWEKGALRL